MNELWSGINELWSSIIIGVCPLWHSIELSMSTVNGHYHGDQSGKSVLCNEINTKAVWRKYQFDNRPAPFYNNNDNSAANGGG